ncbi:Clp protease N-terminal domain-containing protein [Mycolicibacterium holsaticum]|jgi:ATP-dependent Clp protease ATP-binding subunit ClpA|uniref:Clp protease n=1 Tax=Mycolicibacterium holsaticum TaxID=152142 RepID=A0A1E3RWF0_9MYCO|nr:Clp protease N-terminal domain-containing protein [Mycolicibacterium holsaticum]MDA4110121.1 Clp protease [Mycolicibacterium holsaticum DSM 44478 = JCM 12374]ODQ93742.1 Clp protease [Mycolicibacterium holsaticum]QZA11967.1 Clp protease [Mycolicibacterium holsaticum DSM 44478 = JCM 12374]UNC10546.1 Clp protease [Mycolicibacterium holsaticum DSM 44478 = JCM 12374]
MFERFSRSARVSVTLAQEEARERESEAIGPQHLLVGVLQSAGRDLAGLLSGYGLTAQVVRERLDAHSPSGDPLFDDDAEALKSIGIDLNAVRDRVNRAFGKDAWDNAFGKSGRRSRRFGHVPLTKPAKKVLELALRETLAHKDSTIGCEHLMLGILRGGDEFTIGLIAEHVGVDELRSAIAGLLDQAA